MEKDKAEAFLQAQDQMAWTIIRPGGLTDDAATGSAALTEDIKVAGSVTRDDVAALVVKALFSKKTDGKVRAGRRGAFEGPVHRCGLVGDDPLCAPLVCCAGAVVRGQEQDVQRCHL